MKRDFFTFLVYARAMPGVGRLAYYTLKMFGIEIPPAVKIGADFELAHGGFGVVIHPNTTIGDGVKMYPGVTLGRADVFRPASRSQFAGIRIEDGVILSSGAKVIGKSGVLRVGRGTILGANAVLLCSTGEDEIWVGVPAKCVGKRSQEELKMELSRREPINSDRR